MLKPKSPSSSAAALALRGRAIAIAVACAFISGLWTSAVLAETGVAAADTAKSVASPAPAKAAGMPAFNIFEYAVDGNSLLSDMAIEQAVSPFLGEDKTLRDVEGARAALERVYRDAGYLTVVVAIPEQNVDSGAVALHVVEAGIDRLKVKGAEYTVASDIRAKVPELAEGNVPNFNKLQAQLTAFNRSADVKATPILRAGKLPGTVEVQLDVEDQLPLHGSVEFSNRQTPNTTADRLAASLRYDNLWQLGHSFGLTLQTAPQRTSDARVVAGTYVLPVGTDGASATVYAVHSRSEFASLTNAPGLGLLGNTDTLGTRVTWPLAATDQPPQTFAFGADYKNIKQTLVVLGGGGTHTPITYVPLVASYNGNWVSQNWFKEDRTTVLDVMSTIGLRGLFGNSDAEFDAKRAGASANYLVLRVGMQHTERFARWALFGKMDMQLPSGPLVPTEQFIGGGAESVRGYLEGELAGDAGVRATLELRTPQINLTGQNSQWKLMGLAFFDMARLVTEKVVVPQADSHRLRGVGFGFRLNAPRGFALELDAARALVDGDTTHAGDKRIHVRTLWGF